MKENKDKYLNFRIPVPPGYEEIFSHFYFAANMTDEVVTKTLLPSYQTILIFSFGTPAILCFSEIGKIETEKCLLLGPIKQSFVYSLPPNSRILVANLKDDAFYRFFGDALLAEHMPISPDDLLNDNCFNTLWTQLDKIGSIHQQIDSIVNFCKPYLKLRNEIIVKLTTFSDGALDPIKTVANLHNQTERNIQLNHKKCLGYTAKEINRYQRFLKAIELLQAIASASAKVDWSEIINQCGYYDQSQLIRDFRHYIKITPTGYLKVKQDICNPKAE
ncbi:AraC family transcriptional regulator [Pedobacter yonginense]|uniref:AraC family transcriptional regulator n=1 Tax=Pedobacter yonginense TaxID=651869 RepID=A0A317EI01_9SPHI|nr:helix-turn-helix domain-containing protein [Pedobacter yonginense]PWS26214.1 AraC family transcriptional regulator [Pedobacter yonginense]